MNIFQKFFARKPKIEPEQKRNYNGADFSRLNSDWLATGSSADNEIRGGLKALRNRCREMERNNDYVRRYFKLIQNNVLGHCGIGLQMKIKERIKKDGVWIERYDKLANNIIEDAFDAWGRKEFCTVGKNLTWRDAQKLVLSSAGAGGAGGGGAGSSSGDGNAGTANRGGGGGGSRGTYTSGTGGSGIVIISVPTA